MKTTSAPLKEYKNQERSTLELTEREKRIVLKAINRLDILFGIEGIAIVLLVISILIYVISQIV